MRYFEHSTLCQVCDLLGLPHPKEDTYKISIIINVDERSEGDEAAFMLEDRNIESEVPLPAAQV